MCSERSLDYHLFLEKSPKVLRNNRWESEFRRTDYEVEQIYSILKSTEFIIFEIEKGIHTIVSSLRSFEKATGYQKFFKLEWYGWTGPETFRLLLLDLLLTGSLDAEEVLGVSVMHSILESHELFSCKSLLLTSDSMYASLSRAAATLASDTWTYTKVQSLSCRFSYKCDRIKTEARNFSDLFHLKDYLSMGLF